MNTKDFDNGRLPDGPFKTTYPNNRLRLDLYVRKFFLQAATNASNDYSKLNVHVYADVNHDKWVANKDSFLYKTARDIKVGVFRLMKADVDKRDGDVQNMSVYDYITENQIKASISRLESWVADNSHPYLSIRPNVSKIAKTGTATKWFVTFAEDKESQKWAGIVRETYSEMYHKKLQKEQDERWSSTHG